MSGRLGDGRRVYELIVLQCSWFGVLVVGDRSTSLDCQLVWREGQRSLKGTVWYILLGEVTYNSRNVFLLFVVWVSKVFFGLKGVSDCLLGLLPIRSTDEGTEKSEMGN